jgi:hypothetical protein
VQVLFLLPNLQEKILNHQSSFSELQQVQKMETKVQLKYMRSKLMLQELQRLFYAMLVSKEKYQTPLSVLQNVFDDNGQPIEIFEQKDIGEFLIMFLERLQEGLGENKILMRKLMEEESLKQIEPFEAINESFIEMRTTTSQVKEVPIEGHPSIVNLEESLMTFDSEE